jgi:MSHA biogenesis protein MshL
MIVESPRSTARPAALVLALLMGLNGCANFSRPLTHPTDAIINAPESRTVDDAGTDASLDIDAGFGSDDMFLLRPIIESARLPNITLRGISVTESGVYDALRLVLKDTGISLNIEGGSKGSERFGPISAFDVKGSLAEVLDNLSESIGFFYQFRKNTLFIQPEQQFVVELPPALSEDNAAGLTNTLQFLGAKDPYIDRLNRSLVFRTNRPSLAKIESYLQKIRETRSLIIYDVNIFQVDLKDNSDTGIQWNKLAWAGKPGLAANPASTATTANPAVAGATTASTAAQNIGNAVSGGIAGMGLGLVLSSSRFSVDMLINFLQTQGNVKAISRPRLAVISGTKGTLRVGQSTTYVSKVGTNFSTSLNQVTTETRDLKTGLDLSLFGDFSDNTVYTRIGLSISEIVSLNKFTALGTDLTLPTTADRELNTVIRARPGDMILLGGITINRDAKDVRRGIAQNGSTDTVTRSELVLALKSKVVYFRGKNYVQTIPKIEPSSPVMPGRSSGEPAEQSDTAAQSEVSGLRLTYALRVDSNLPVLASK